MNEIEMKHNETLNEKGGRVAYVASVLVSIFFIAWISVDSIPTAGDVSSIFPLACGKYVLNTHISASCKCQSVSVESFLETNIMSRMNRNRASECRTSVSRPGFVSHPQRHGIGSGPAHQCRRTKDATAGRKSDGKLAVLRQLLLTRVRRQSCLFIPPSGACFSTQLRPGHLQYASIQWGLPSLCCLVLEFLVTASYRSM